MKFLYCKECNNLRPRGWMLFNKRCEKCHYEMEKFDVKMSIVAPFYYASLVALMIVITLYLIDWEIPYGMNSIILLLILTMVLAFLDYNISYTRAKEKIAKDAESRKA